MPSNLTIHTRKTCPGLTLWKYCQRHTLFWERFWRQVELTSYTLPGAKQPGSVYPHTPCTMSECNLSCQAKAGFGWCGICFFFCSLPYSAGQRREANVESDSKAESMQPQLLHNRNWDTFHYVFFPFNSGRLSTVSLTYAKSVRNGFHGTKNLIG